MRDNGFITGFPMGVEDTYLSVFGEFHPGDSITVETLEIRCLRVLLVACGVVKGWVLVSSLMARARLAPSHNS